MGEGYIGILCVRTYAYKGLQVRADAPRIPSVVMIRPFFITWVFLHGVFFKTPRKNTPDFKVCGLLFSHFITWVKKVRGVFKINATSSLNFEISRQLSDLLLSTLRLTWMENAVAFSTQPSYVSDFDMCSDGFFPLMAILIHNF